MQLVLYDDNGLVLETHDLTGKVEVEGNSVRWQDGFLSGIAVKFGVLPDGVTVRAGDTLTSSVASQFLSTDQFQSPVASLKAQTSAVLLALVKQGIL
jgi:hypothetical protein